MSGFVIRRTSTLDDTSIVAEEVRVAINGAVKDGVILESLELNPGTTYDSCAITVCFQEGVANQVSAVGATGSLNVAGGYGSQYWAGDEVTLLTGSSVFWRGFIAKRLTYPTNDSTTYICHDIRWFLRDNVAGSLIWFDGDLDPTYTHRREVFNDNGIPNKTDAHVAFMQAPYYRYTDGTKQERWDGPSIVLYLKELRLRQYNALVDSVATQTNPIDHHAQGVVSENTNRTSFKLIPDDFGQEIKAQARGIGVSPPPIDNLNFNGSTYLDAFEKIGRLHGLTLCTVNGVLRYRATEVDKNKAAVVITSSDIEGVEIEDDFTNSYGAAVNLTKPDAVESLVDLVPGWTDAEQEKAVIEIAKNMLIENAAADTESVDALTPPTTLVGKALNQKALGDALDRFWQVFAVFHAPTIAAGDDAGTGVKAGAEILPHLSRVGKIVNDPERGIVLWFDNAGTFTRIPVEKTGYSVSPELHTLNLFGARAPGYTFAYDPAKWSATNWYQDGQVFTRRTIRAVLAVEGPLAYSGDRTAVALGANHPTLNALDNKSNSYENSFKTVANFITDDELQTYSEPPPHIVAWNLSSARSMRAQESVYENVNRKVAGTKQEFVDETLHGSDTFYTAMMSPSENLLLGNHSAKFDLMTKRNRDEAMRFLRTNRPKTRARITCSSPMTGIHVGDVLRYEYTTNTGNWQANNTLVVTSVKHTCAGRQGPPGVPVDLIVSTEIGIGF